VAKPNPHWHNQTPSLRSAWASPQAQYQVLDKLLSFAHRREAEFFIWFLPRDYDGLWEKIRAEAPEFFGVWRDCGLLDGKGK